MAIAEAPGSEEVLERPRPAIDMERWRLERDAARIAELGAPPTSAMPEAVLFHALRGGPAPVERTEPCACGGFITALDGDERSIQVAVGRHKESLTHRAWRFER